MNAIAAAWNRFFFAEQSPLPICIFRILYGTMVTLTLLLLKQDWLNWYGTHAWISVRTMRELQPGMSPDLFSVIPQDDRYITAFFWFFLASAVLLALGFFTRTNTIFTYLCLTTIHHRNVLILHGGDTFLRVAGFFLIFAPAGAALSLDHLLRVRRKKESPEIQPRAPWAQRMIQLELSLVYLVSFLTKLKGRPWLDGSALYYVTHLLEFQRFPLPAWALEPGILKIGTWIVLAAEFSLGCLIWIKRLRYKLLAIGLLFHLGMEYTLNVPMFQWDILSAYVLFIDPQDLERAWAWVRGRASAATLISETKELPPR